MVREPPGIDEAALEARYRNPFPPRLNALSLPTIPVAEYRRGRSIAHVDDVGVSRELDARIVDDTREAFLQDVSVYILLKQQLEQECHREIGLKRWRRECEQVAQLATVRSRH